MLEKNIGYTFKNRELLKIALTHKSWTEKGKKVVNNERLEFLGDSILGFTAAEYLYENYKKLPEGELTKIRSLVVCEKALFKIAMSVNLGEFIRMGRGEEQSDGRRRPSILSDAMEALFAAIYLDGGIEEAKRVILSFLKDEVEDVIKNGDFRDFKTLLQELIQKDGRRAPEYKLIGESGPDHDKIFCVSVSVEGRVVAEGMGKSKKEAEKQAAKKAVDILNKNK